MSNHGPAKPQRTLAASTSPLMMSKDSLIDELRECSSTTTPQGMSVDTKYSNSMSPGKSNWNPTLLNPGPFIIDADAEDEGEITPTNVDFNEILASMNLSWDYVTKLQEQNLGKDLPLLFHERKESMGNYSSSGCSDTGSTFKELFGPIRYEEVMAPLASPETLSEISSMSSRASFFIPKDQSPLFRVKISRNGNGSNCASLHRYRNGKDTNGLHLQHPGGSHNRSFSCTYPEKGELNTISGQVCGSAQSYKVLPLLFNGNNKAQNAPEIGETTVETTDYVEDMFEGDGESVTPHAEETENSGAEGHARKNGDTKRVSFNLKKKFASKDSGCSVGDASFGTNVGRYEPIYPIFSHQEEYGVPPLNSPHYTYRGQSPVDSPDVIFSNPKSTRFAFPDAMESGSGATSSSCLHDSPSSADPSQQ